MKIMNEMNLAAHQGRPLTPENKRLTLWKPSNRFIHCCIESRGCRFSRDNGACIMCDYGIGEGLSASELEKALRKELRPKLDGISMLLFGSYGSVFDTGEISEECFDVILEFAAGQGLEEVIFETHCCTVNEEILAKIQKKFSAPGTRATVEMGYESCDAYVLENCLNKVLNLEQLCRAVALIHKYGMEASLNVFLGAPFLSVSEQLDTAVESVKWAFDKGADSVVVFPCNIKPFTLLYRLYERQIYRPVSQWMLVELLSRIPEELLGRVTLSWYGDRSNFYENDQFPLIPPKDCEKCHDKIFEFYRGFMGEREASKRKRLVERFIQREADCGCREEFLEELKNRRRRLSAEEIKELLQRIK